MLEEKVDFPDVEGRRASSPLYDCTDPLCSNAMKVSQNNQPDHTRGSRTEREMNEDSATIIINLTHNVAFTSINARRLKKSFGTYGFPHEALKLEITAIIFR